MPAGPTRDIRLDVDPTIQRRVEDAAAADEPRDMEVSPEEEERLLKEDSPPIQDYDLSSLPGPDISGCPVSCGGAVIGWVQVYYRSAGVGQRKNNQNYCASDAPSVGFLYGSKR